MRPFSEAMVAADRSASDGTVAAAAAPAPSRRSKCRREKLLMVTAGGPRKSPDCNEQAFGAISLIVTLVLEIPSDAARASRYGAVKVSRNQLKFPTSFDVPGA